MPIRYSLQQDALNHSGTYHAHVNPTVSLSLEDLVDRMAGASNTVERPRLFAVASLLMETVTQALSQGEQVNLPICRLRPAIRGTFNDQGDSYSPDRHDVTVVVAAGAELKKRLAQASVEREPEGRGTDRPQPKALRRVPEGDPHDDIVHPGDVMEIVGRRLKFDPTGEDEGLFLQPLPEDDAVSPGPPIPVPRVIKRTEQRLMFQVPEAPAGRYQCLVRRRFGRHANHLREALVPGVLSLTDSDGAAAPPPANVSLAGRVRFSERLARVAEAASGDPALKQM